MSAPADRPVEPVVEFGGLPTPKPVIVELLTGSEGTIHLVAVPFAKLDLSVTGTARYDRDHRLLITLTGSSDLPHDTECAVVGILPEGIAGPSKSTSVALGSSKLANNGGPAKLELAVDVFEKGLFFDGALRFHVRPDYPSAPAHSVKGELDLEHRATMNRYLGDAATVLIGTEFDVDPEIGNALKDWCALRLSLWEHRTAEKRASSAAEDDDDGADSVVWDASLGFERRTIRLGCSPLEGSAVLVYPATRAHAGVDAGAAGPLLFSHVLAIEAANPQKPDKPFRYELVTRGFSVPKPALTIFELTYTEDFIIAQGKVANLAEALKLRLDLSLWTAQPLSQGGRLVLVDPVAKADVVLSEDGTFSKILVDLHGEEGAKLAHLRAEDLFCVARIPVAVAPSERWAFAHVIDYDEQKFVPLRDEDLLDDFDPADRRLADPKRKSPKQLASAVASSDLLTIAKGDAPQVARLPEFLSFTTEVRGEQLYVSCSLRGPFEYWQKAAPAFSLNVGAQAVQLTGSLVKSNGLAFEAKTALSTVCGKTIKVTASAPNAPDRWHGEPVVKPAPRSTSELDCTPALKAPTVTITADKTIVVECQTSWFPTHPGNKTLLVEVLEVTASGDVPVPAVTLRYDYPVGGEGVCGAGGRLVARISPGAPLQATKRYKVRVRRKQVNGTVYGVPVQPSDAVSIP
jgi:hypothetical protein